MQRRTLLRSLAAAGLGASLTGCLSDDSSPGGGGDTTAPTNPDTASSTPTVGHTDTRPEGKRTTGDGTTSPSGDPETTAPDGPESVTPTEPDPPQTTASGERTTTEDTDETDAAGSSPEIASTDLAVTSRDCASAEISMAEVTFADGSVTVAGKVVTANPCKNLSIEAASYDQQRGRLTIAIGTSSSEKVCQQCLGSVGYTATVTLENDLPAEVAVEHRSRNQSKTVATTTRDDA
jgi:hypothetical protein